MAADSPHSLARDSVTERILVSLPAPKWEAYDDDSIKWNSSAHSSVQYDFYWINVRTFVCYINGDDGRSFRIASDCKSLDEAKEACWQHWLSELGAEVIGPRVESGSH